MGRREASGRQDVPGTFPSRTLEGGMHFLVKLADRAAVLGLRAGSCPLLQGAYVASLGDLEKLAFPPRTAIRFSLWLQVVLLFCIRPGHVSVSFSSLSCHGDARFSEPLPTLPGGKARQHRELALP